MTEPIDNPLIPTTGTEKISPAAMPPFKEQDIPEQTTTRPFEPLMSEPLTGEPPPSPTPMQLAAGNQQGQWSETEVTPQSLHDGLDRLNQQVGNLKGELTSQRFSEMTNSQKALLKTKLNQFGQNVQGLSQRLGSHYTMPKPKGLLDDVKTVINWLSEGQTQLQSVGDEMAKKTKGQISVVSMLRAQAQLLAAERAINFATAIVSKGSDFISKIMQTQL